MNRSLLRGSLFLFLVGACSAEGNNSFLREAGAGDGGGDATLGDGAMCPGGSWVCVGDMAQQCNGAGGFSVRTDCRADGRICVPGVGCGMCRPNQRRCSPDNPQQAQECAADGTTWQDAQLCDPAEGRTCNNGICEDRCATQNTYLGCEYWPTQMANSQLDPAFRFAVVLANPQNYEVRVQISGGALSNPLVRMLAPEAVEVVNLPSVREINPGCTDLSCPLATSLLRRGGAYHVRANGPIAAYQFNPLEYRTGSTYSYTADASLLLPTNTLANYYIVAARQNWQARDRLGNPTSTVLGGAISIVPVSGETEVTVNVRQSASVSAGPGVMASGPGMRSYRVGVGDVLQLIGRSANEDLTGTIIESSSPLAVFGGHDCTNVPADRPACDHLEEQLLPAQAWGRRYVVSQLRDRNNSEQYVVRFIAQRDDLRLSFNGIPAPAECSAALGIGRYCEITNTGNFEVTGTQPFLAVQYMMGQGPLQTQCAGTNPPAIPECMGDPAMVMEIPVEQYRQSYDFLVPSTYVRNFVNVVAPESARITMDGVMLSREGVAVGNTTYRVYFVPVMPGRHHIESSSSDTRFGIKVYGVAPYTSYAFPGGLDLAPISPPG